MEADGVMSLVETNGSIDSLPSPAGLLAVPLDLGHLQLSPASMARAQLRHSHLLSLVFDDLTSPNVLGSEVFPNFDLHRRFSFSSVRSRSRLHRESNGSMDYDDLLSLDQDVLRRGVSPDTISKLPVRDAGWRDQTTKCQICMEVLTGKSKVITLPCNHEFCGSCIRHWLKNHITCPLCRWRFPEDQTVLVDD